MPKKTIRVAFLDHIRTEIGGRHFVLARLANYYHTHNLGIVPIVYLNNFDGFIDKFISAEIEVEVPFLDQKLVQLSRDFNVFQFLKTSYALVKFFIQFCFKFNRLLQESEIDIVHANGIAIFILTALPVKLARKKLIFHMHDVLLTSKEGGNIEKPAQKVLLFFIRYYADAVIALSDFVKDSLISKHACISSKIYRIYNGIVIGDVETRKVSESSVHAELISFGRILREKGFDLGIKAISILKHRYGKNIKYRIIGTGKCLDELKQLALDLKVDDLVVFEGFQNDIRSYIAHADIVLVPSRWQEPFGLSTIESWEQRKVVIATSVGAIPEIIEDGINGFLIPIENAPEKIAEKILLVLNNPGIKEKLVQNAYNRLYKDFTLERMATEIALLYRSIG